MHIGFEDARPERGTVWRFLVGTLWRMRNNRITLPAACNASCISAACNFFGRFFNAASSSRVSISRSIVSAI